MELRHLRYFAGVARERNMTRAAANLRVAQPALSRQIRQLEEELGVALLEREVRGVRLTRAGEVFLREAEAILARSEEAIRAAQLSESVRREQLSVGYVWGLFHTQAPVWIGRFRAGHPRAAVNLLDLSATQQVVALEQGRIDLGLIGFAFEADGAGLAKAKVGECAFVAALPEGHPEARKRRVALRSLANDCFFVISEQSYPGAAHFVKDACQRAGFRPRILQTAERGYTLLGLVAGNCGVTLLPESLRALPHPGVVFRPLAEPPRGDLYAAWNPGKESGLARAFIDQCSAAASSASPTF
jgi:DNA-binding transcriptional LysR family regulator